MNQNDQMRDLLNEARQIIREVAPRHSLNDFDSRVQQALNHTPDTGKMVDHVGDANKMVRLTDDEIECARLEWCKTGWEVANFANAIMDAMIKKNGCK